MTSASAIGCALAVVVLLVATRAGWRQVEVVAKCTASALFIAHALFLGVAGAGVAGALVIAGLVLGAVGDVLLLWDARKPFLAGLVAFLVAHVAYVGAFAALGLSPPGTAVGASIVAPLSYGVWRWLGGHVGKMAGPVIAYMIVISAMVATAHGALSHTLSPGRLVLMLAALLFFASDLFVARQRFVAKGFVNRLIGLPLYYGAQLLFGWGAALELV